LRLHEEDWQLIEHIRATGQLGSGAWVGPDEPRLPLVFGPPQLIIDNAGAERTQLELEQRAARRQELNAELTEIRKQADRRKAYYAKRKREQLETERAAREYLAEQRELERQRREERKRRDAEWVAAHPDEVAAQRRVKAQVKRLEAAERERKWLASETHRLFSAPWLTAPGASVEADEHHRVVRQQCEAQGWRFHHETHLRRAIIQALCSSFPHLADNNSDAVINAYEVVKTEFSDIDFVAACSRVRGGMGFYQLLWLRTRWLMGFH
jgi:hypothetical protein